MNAPGHMKTLYYRVCAVPIDFLCVQRSMEKNNKTHFYFGFTSFSDFTECVCYLFIQL